MTRFGTAVQLLLELADSNTPLPSPFLASRLQADPSRIRQMLGRLGDAGLTRSKLGPGGGAVLAKDENVLTLGEVYLAVVDAGGPAHARVDLAIADAISGVSLSHVRRSNAVLGRLSARRKS